MEFLTLHYKFISSSLKVRLSDYSHSSVEIAINIQYEQPIWVIVSGAGYRDQNRLCLPALSNWRNKRSVSNKILILKFRLIWLGSFNVISVNLINGSQYYLICIYAFKSFIFCIMIILIIVLLLTFWKILTLPSTLTPWKQWLVKI